MALNDPLAACMSKILNAEKIGKQEVMIRHSSRIIKDVLKVMKENRYIGEFIEKEDSKGNSLNLNLLGNINKCGAVKPRFSVKIDGFEKFEKRYLPAKDFGILIISTPNGVMTHIQAKEKKTGGRIIAYCY